MLTNPTPSRRLAGKLMIVGALAIALPLTATRAIQLVDVAAPTPPTPPTALLAPLAPIAPLAPLTPAAMPVAPIAPLPPVAPAAPRVTPGEADISFIRDDSVRIHGKTKRWEELTAAERAKIRLETAKARQELDRQMARLPAEMAQARREAARFSNGEFRREMAEARVAMRQALAELDAQAAVIRATGQNPEKLKAEIRASLREVEAMDIDKIVREAMESVNPDKIAAELGEAQASLSRVRSRLDAADRND